MRVLIARCCRRSPLNHHLHLKLTFLHSRRLDNSAYFDVHRSNNVEAQRNRLNVSRVLKRISTAVRAVFPLPPLLSAIVAIEMSYLANLTLAGKVVW